MNIWLLLCTFTIAASVHLKYNNYCFYYYSVHLKYNNYFFTIAVYILCTIPIVFIVAVYILSTITIVFTIAVYIWRLWEKIFIGFQFTNTRQNTHGRSAICLSIWWL